MLDIQVKHMTSTKVCLSCFTDEVWIQKDTKKLNCKANPENVLPSAVEVKWVS